MAPPLAELTAQAQSLTSAGDLDGARAVLAHVLDPADAADPQRATADLAVAAALHARILIALGDPHSARLWAGFAHAAEERLHGPRDERTLSAAATHAAVLHRVGNHGRAAQLYHDLVLELINLDGPDSPRVLAAQADLATAEHAAGHCTAARARLTEAWAHHRRVYGDAAPAGIKMLARLGAMERECGREQDSQQHLALAQELCARYLPDDHPLGQQVAALAEAPASGRHVCGRVTQSVGPEGPVPGPAFPSPEPAGAGAAPGDPTGRHARVETPKPLPGDETVHPTEEIPTQRAPQRAGAWPANRPATTPPARATPPSGPAQRPPTADDEFALPTRQRRTPRPPADPQPPQTVPSRPTAAPPPTAAPRPAEPAARQAEPRAARQAEPTAAPADPTAPHTKRADPTPRRLTVKPPPADPPVFVPLPPHPASTLPEPPSRRAEPPADPMAVLAPPTVAPSARARPTTAPPAPQPQAQPHRADPAPPRLTALDQTAVIPQQRSQPEPPTPQQPTRSAAQPPQTPAPPRDHTAPIPQQPDPSRPRQRNAEASPTPDAQTTSDQSAVNAEQSRHPHHSAEPAPPRTDSRRTDQFSSGQPTAELPRTRPGAAPADPPRGRSAPPPAPGSAAAGPWRVGAGPAGSEPVRPVSPSPSAGSLHPPPTGRPQNTRPPTRPGPAAGVSRVTPADQPPGVTRVGPPEHSERSENARPDSAAPVGWRPSATPPPPSAPHPEVVRPRPEPLSDRRLPVPVQRPEKRNWQPFLLVAVLVAGILVAGAIIFATLPRDDDTTAVPPPVASAPAGSVQAVPPPSAAPTKSPIGGAPENVKLRDNRDSVSLTWSYPKDSEGPVLISGGRTGQEQRAFQQLPAGTTDYVVYGLNAGQDYCFTVAVVYTVDRVAASKAVCTQRK